MAEIWALNPVNKYLEDENTLYMRYMSVKEVIIIIAILLTKKWLYSSQNRVSEGWKR